MLIQILKPLFTINDSYIFYNSIQINYKLLLIVYDIYGTACKHIILRNTKNIKW